jgi:hypothetical protein
MKKPMKGMKPERATVEKVTGDRPGDGTTATAAFFKRLTKSHNFLLDGREPDGVSTVIRNKKGDVKLITEQMPLRESDALTNISQCAGWQFLGAVMSYLMPSGGTEFNTWDVQDQAIFDSLLETPLKGADLKPLGITYREKIMCKLMDVGYATYIALRDGEVQP